MTVDELRAHLANQPDDSEVSIAVGFDPNHDGDYEFDELGPAQTAFVVEDPRAPSGRVVVLVAQAPQEFVDFVRNPTGSG